jgi:hypothetical protein
LDFSLTTIDLIVFSDYIPNILFLFFGDDMNAIETMRRQLRHISYELSVVNAEMKFRKLMRMLDAKFDPDQPRDELGRWTDAGASAGSDTTDFSAARRGQSEAICWSQYTVDMLRCQSELRASARAICSSQAMERYAACRSGRPIPPLSF